MIYQGDCLDILPTLVVAEKLDRKYIGIELNSQYTKLAEDRIYNVQPLFAGVNP